MYVMSNTDNYLAKTEENVGNIMMIQHAGLCTNYEPVKTT